MTLFVFLCLFFTSFIAIKTEVEAECSNEPKISIKSLYGDFVVSGFRKKVKRQVFSADEQRSKRSSNQIYDHVDAMVFLNLPYAEPICLETAFHNAELVSDETYNNLKINRAYRSFGNICPQDPDYACQYTSYLGMDIDCLNLNVFSPPETNLPKAMYPVYVLLHGGNFVRGSSMDFGMDGLISNFVAEGIVVVTVNYRLGAYGFENIAKGKGSEEGHSTRGFYDQLLALKWVQKYIANFGGNKSDVTLGGYGSGASSASMLAHYQMEKGINLFQKMILHGGTADTGRTFGIFDHTFQKELKAKLNCATGNMTVQQQCLRERHWVDVVNATTSIAPYGMEFSVPDGGFKSPANYSTKLVESKNQLKILYGINQDEFYGFERAFYYEHEKECNKAPFHNTDIVNKTFMILMNPNDGWHNINANSTGLKKLGELSSEAKNLLSEVFNHYFHREGEFSVHLPESITQLFGDFVFTANMVKEAKRFTSIGHKVWIYKFGYAGKLEDQYDKHVTHGADVNYAYMAIDKWRKIMNAATVSRKEANQEVRVSRNIALTLTYFIKHHGSDRKQFNSSKLNYFDIKKDNVESDQPIIKPHVLEMWERLSRQLRKKKTALEKEVTTTTLAPKDGKQAKKQKRKADYKNYNYYDYKDYKHRYFDYYNDDYKNYKDYLYKTDYHYEEDPESLKSVVRVGGSLVTTLNAISRAAKIIAKNCTQ